MTVQIAVKLPETLAGELDRLVARGDFANRSQAMREGLETIIAARDKEQLRERYREAFTRQPETAAELEESRRLAIESIEEEPWERWW